MVHLIMCEFGAERQSAGKAELPRERLEPTLGSMAEYFPGLRLTVYTDCLTDFATGSIPTEVKSVTPHFDPEHPRYGWRCADYYRAVGLLESTAEVAVYMDSDLRVVSERVRALIPLTRRFGLCIPVNPRPLVRTDGVHGVDSDYEIGEDESLGLGFASNLAPIAFATSDTRMRTLLECYRDLCEKRGTVALWRAIWKTGIHPYQLPYQWCVSKGQLGIDEPIILHVGQRRVARYYANPANLLPERKRRWNPLRNRKEARP